jgi:putative MATE family efflux protein
MLGTRASAPPVVTHRTVLAIAVPMTLAYVTTPLLGLVDTAVVGQMGEAALIGGLAAGALVFDVVFTTFNFLRSGTTGLVAQAMGRGDAAEEQAVFWRAIILALVAGLALVLAAPLAASLGEIFLHPEPAVAEAMRTYVGIRMFGAPLTLINYAVLGYVLGRGEATFGLALQLLLNGVNIVLSIVLGLHLAWGVAGVAWGTVIGEGVAAAIGLALLWRRFARGPRLPLSRVLDATAFRTMLSLNRDIMIRSFALLAAFALFTRGGAELGTVTLAANAVLMNIFMIGAFFLDGFATAAEQLAGRAYGARHGEAFRRAVRLCLIWSFAIAAASALAFWLAGDGLVALLTTATDVREAASAYLPWAVLTVVSGVLAFQMDGVFIGATWSSDMRNMMLLSLACFVAALWALAPWGNHGLWTALHLFLLVRGFSLLAILRLRLKSFG